MDTKAVLANPQPRRNRYDSVMALIVEAAGQWVSIPFEELNGRYPGAKQFSIHQAAISRGRKVETTVQDGRVFVRLIVPAVQA